MADLVRSLVQELRVVEIAELRKQPGRVTDSRHRDLLHQLVDLRHLEKKFEQGEISMCPGIILLQY